MARLGDALVERGIIGPGQRDEALELALRSGQRLGNVLLAKQFVTRLQLGQTLAEQWDVPFVDLIAEPPDDALLKTVDPAWLLKHQVVPWRWDGDQLIVCSSDQADDDVGRQLLRQFGARSIRWTATTPWDIDRSVATAHADHLVDSAVNGLYLRSPKESGYTVLTRAQFVVFAILAIAYLAVLVLVPRPTLLISITLLNLMFTATIVF